MHRNDPRSALPWPGNTPPNPPSPLDHLMGQQPQAQAQAQPQVQAQAQAQAQPQAQGPVPSPAPAPVQMAAEKRPNDEKLDRKVLTFYIHAYMHMHKKTK